MKFKFITIISLIVLLLIFIFQNSSIVELKFLFWSFSVSSLLLVIISFLIGILTGLLLIKSGNNKDQT